MQMRNAKSLSGGARIDDLLGDLHRSKERQRRESRSWMYKAALAALSVLLFAAWLRSGGSRAPVHATGSQEKVIHCYFLIDRTGSMRPLQSAVLQGFQSYVKEQREQPGSMLLTLAQFSSEKTLDIKWEARDIHSAEVQSFGSYDPRGATPLYDALALLIEHASKAAAARGEMAGGAVSGGAVPGGADIVVVIFSDGKENASRQYTRLDVFKLIEDRRKAGWTFVFLGANQVRAAARDTCDEPCDGWCAPRATHGRFDAEMPAVLAAPCAGLVRDGKQAGDGLRSHLQVHRGQPGRSSCMVGSLRCR